MPYTSRVMRMRMMSRQSLISARWWAGRSMSVWLVIKSQTVPPQTSTTWLGHMIPPLVSWSPLKGFPSYAEPPWGHYWKDSSGGRIKAHDLPTKPSSLGRQVFLGYTSRIYGVKVSTKAGLSEVTLESVGIQPAERDVHNWLSLSRLIIESLGLLGHHKIQLVAFWSTNYFFFNRFHVIDSFITGFRPPAFSSYHISPKDSWECIGLCKVPWGWIVSGDQFFKGSLTWGNENENEAWDSPYTSSFQGSWNM